MEREDAIEDLPCICKSGCLFDVLAQEGTEILNNLVRWLGNLMNRTELDKCCYGYGGTALKINILFILKDDLEYTFEKKSFKFSP